MLYSALLLCDMCSGAVFLYKISRVVIGENQTFRGPEDYLRSRSIGLEIANAPEGVRLMRSFITSNRALWDQDIGEQARTQFASSAA